MLPRDGQQKQAPIVLPFGLTAKHFCTELAAGISRAVPSVKCVSPGERRLNSAHCAVTKVIVLSILAIVLGLKAMLSSLMRKVRVTA